MSVRNDRGESGPTKTRSRRRPPPYAVGLLISAIAHIGLAVTFVTNEVAVPLPFSPPPQSDPRLVAVEEPPIDPPPAVRIPPPSVPIPRPEAPVEGSEPLPPAVEPLQPPEVIPHDIPPRLVNGPTVLTALEEGYPADLPETAADSRVLLWLFVDASGAVTKLRVQDSSGYEALDRLATDVAPVMSYSPALHRGERVAVWVAQRIRFTPPAGTPP